MSTMSGGVTPAAPSRSGLNEADSVLLKLVQDPEGYRDKLKELRLHTERLSKIAGIVDTLKKAENKLAKAAEIAMLADETLDSARAEASKIIKVADQRVATRKKALDDKLAEAQHMIDEAREVEADAKTKLRSAHSKQSALTAAREKLDAERATFEVERKAFNERAARLKAALG